MDKMMVSGRVYPYIRDYFHKKKLSISDVLSEYYKICKSKELPEMLKELEKARNYVLQIEQNVLQLESECNTNWAKCNTLFEQLNKQDGFDINNLNEQDKFRITSLLDKNDIHDITVAQFIIHYQESGEDSRGGVVRG